MVHWANNYRCTPGGRADGLSPYERKKKKAPTKNLVPFACKVVFHENPDKQGGVLRLEKFEPRGRLGFVLGYGPLGSYIIGDFEHWRATHGTLKVVTTRSVKVHPGVFPFKELEPSLVRAWSLRMRLLDMPDVDYRIDGKGRAICARPDCKKLILDEAKHPVTCKICLGKSSNRHSEGRPPVTCRRSRCPGHPKTEDDDDFELRVGDQSEREPRKRSRADEAPQRGAGEPEAGSKPKRLRLDRRSFG